MTTKIEWTEETWNPVTGCSKVSEGCRNCYAERLDKRFNKDHKPWTAINAEHNVQLHPDRLDIPLKRKKPTMWFVNSMSDLFHEQVPDEFLDEVFGSILACKVFANKPDHTFQILTKRPERMHQYFTSASPAELLKRWAQSMDGVAIVDNPDILFSELVYSETCHQWDESGRNSNGSEYKPWGYTESLFPLPNVWLGVSVEDQKAADERIPLLLQTPAAIRFLSCEPLLGPVNLEVPMPGAPVNGIYSPWHIQSGIDWVIAGGESGQNARPMSSTWVRKLRDQCNAAGVAFFFKQWGEWIPWGENQVQKMPGGSYKTVKMDGVEFIRFGKKNNGRTLDGRTWDEMPERT